MTRKTSAVRAKAIKCLEESKARGDSPKVTLQRLSKLIDMGVPAARSVRDMLIRQKKVRYDGNSNDD